MLDAESRFSSRAVSEVQASEDVSVYKPRERATKNKVSTYVPDTTKAGIDKIGRLWTAIDQASDPKASAWSESETVRRLIEASLEMAWHEMGGEPATEADLARAISAASKLRLRKP